MPEPDFYLREGDLASYIERTLTDDDDLPVNLTGAGVLFHGTPIGGTAPTIGGTAVIVGAATSGVVRYQWDANDTAVPGVYRCAFPVTFAGGTTQTFPNDDWLLLYITPR